MLSGFLHHVKENTSSTRYFFARGMSFQNLSNKKTILAQKKKERKKGIFTVCNSNCDFLKKNYIIIIIVCTHTLSLKKQLRERDGSKWSLPFIKKPHSLWYSPKPPNMNMYLTKKRRQRNSGIYLTHRVTIPLEKEEERNLTLCLSFSLIQCFSLSLSLLNVNFRLKL